MSFKNTEPTQAATAEATMPSGLMASKAPIVVTPQPKTTPPTKPITLVYQGFGSGGGGQGRGHLLGQGVPHQPTSAHQISLTSPARQPNQG